VHKLVSLTLLVLSVGTARVSYANTANVATAAGDSLVEILPLALGNQWTYEYRFSTFLDQFGTYHDTGSATIRIVGRIITADTITWLLQETHRLWMNHDSGAYSPLPVSIDTIQLIELQQGQHRLYINGDASEIASYVFSFFPHVDTSVYRYNRVDTSGTRTVSSRNLTGKGVFFYSFRQGIGLSSVLLSDGCTCMDGFSGHHSLRAWTVTSVIGKQNLPGDYGLAQNFPNPFNPTTTIVFQVPFRSYVSLKIFDCIGREIETLVDEELLAGSYARQWNPHNMSSGVYFYRLRSGPFVEMKKLILVK
jgi:hypothetical protein